MEASDGAGVKTDDISTFESLTGKGIQADFDGETYFAGKPALFEELGISLDAVRVASDGGVVVEDAGSLESTGGGEGVIALALST